MNHVLFICYHNVLFACIRELLLAVTTSQFILTIKRILFLGEITQQ